jgi:hypothetical protein
MGTALAAASLPGQSSNVSRSGSRATRARRGSCLWSTNRRRTAWRGDRLVIWPRPLVGCELQASCPRVVRLAPGVLEHGDGGCPVQRRVRQARGCCGLRAQYFDAPGFHRICAALSAGIESERTPAPIPHQSTGDADLPRAKRCLRWCVSTSCHRHSSDSPENKRTLHCRSRAM